jgi:two-component system phosphate regulon sensor histidine kinase PhoR
MVISMSESFSRTGDSNKNFTFERKGPPGEIFRFLYNVDSLQDSLRVKEIDSACRIAFDKEGMNVPISILKDTNVNRRDRFPQEEMRVPNKITIGFAHPVTYQLSLGNTFGYLIKKLASPILFSLFLVGVTVVSFFLLYRNLQRQRKLTEIKNEFISNITHELKTPIATVGVAIEALRNFNAINDPQRTKEYLDISQNELQRLSLLVDKVLKLSMFEKKEIELKYELLDLKGVVDEVVSSMRLQIEKYHATVSVNNEGDTHLQGDRLHLLSVVFNLLDNALKYGNGNIAIKFDLREKENEVELSVADNGIGISPEYKDKVFEKFFRVPLGNTHNTKGYGLGLSYVSHVVQRHNGKIEVESQPGLGSKFIITLPKVM